jgi:hypothetical protein
MNTSGMNLRAGNGWPPRLPVAAGPFDRDGRLVLGHFAQGFGQLAGRPAWRVRLLGVPATGLR